MAFQKATKQKSKLRAAIFGPSGAGKTFSALRIATGMGDKIAVVDTEHGSASKYADRFNFDVCELNAAQDIEAYIGAIKEAGKAGYPVLVIDSLTHGWRELLQEIDRLAKTKYRGNTWGAWSEGTPKQREFVNALLEYPGHIIATIRSKTEWTTEVNPRNGKSAPIRVGLAPDQGKGIEYEFDLLLEINTEHMATVIKDRTDKFQDQCIDKPDEEFGKKLLAWLNDGVEPSKPTPPAPNPPAKIPAQSAHLQKLNLCVAQYGITDEVVAGWLKYYKVNHRADLTAAQVDKIVAGADKNYGRK